MSFGRVGDNLESEQPTAIARAPRRESGRAERNHALENEYGNIYGSKGGAVP